MATVTEPPKQSYAARMAMREMIRKGMFGDRGSTGYGGGRAVGAATSSGFNPFGTTAPYNLNMNGWSAIANAIAFHRNEAVQNSMRQAYQAAMGRLQGAINNGAAAGVHPGVAMLQYLTKNPQDLVALHMTGAFPNVMQLQQMHNNAILMNQRQQQFAGTAPVNAQPIPGTNMVNVQGGGVKGGKGDVIPTQDYQTQQLRAKMAVASGLVQKPKMEPVKSGMVYTGPDGQPIRVQAMIDQNHPERGPQPVMGPGGQPLPLNAPMTNDERGQLGSFQAMGNALTSLRHNMQAFQEFGSLNIIGRWKAEHGMGTPSQDAVYGAVNQVRALAATGMTKFPRLASLFQNVMNTLPAENSPSGDVTGVLMPKLMYAYKSAVAGWLTGMRSNGTYIDPSIIDWAKKFGAMPGDIKNIDAINQFARAHHPLNAAQQAYIKSHIESFDTDVLRDAGINRDTVLNVETQQPPVNPPQGSGGTSQPGPATPPVIPEAQAAPAQQAPQQAVPRPAPKPAPRPPGRPVQPPPATYSGGMGLPSNADIQNAVMGPNI